VGRRARLDALLFAQRRFAAEFATGAHGVGDETRWLEPAADFGTVPTLLLTLEQVGFVEPVDYRSAARAAVALAQGIDASTTSRRLALFQAAVALVARCERVGSIDGAAARAMISDLFRAASMPAEDYATAILQRVRQLLERLPGSAAGGSAEDRLLDGLAGVGVAGAKPVIEWEGRRYEVDAARAERKRLGAICEMQGGRTLDTVIALGTSVGELLDPGSSPERVGAAAAAAATAAGGGEPGEEWLFGFRLDGVRNGLVEAAQDAGRKPGQPRSDGIRRRLAAGLEADLAAVLVSHVYALWLDPESPLVAGDSPGRRHDFGLGGPGNGPWAFARQADLGSTRGVRGSLLGLDRCLAREVLRPTRLGLPERAPTLRPEDARGLAESIVALNPFRLTAGAGLVAGAVKRGRARVTAAARDVAALDTLLASAGVDGIRRRLARVAAADGPEAVLDQLSLAELLALGEDFRAPVPGAVLAHWGTAARLVDGSLGQRMPRRLAWLERAWRPGAGLLPTQVADLQIRTAEWLADRRLPSALAHGILSLAAWDLALTVQVSSPDDWLPVVRAAQAVPPERFEDYVSALAATGVLVPLPPGK
jgi:hypothetical protein